MPCAPWTGRHPAPPALTHSLTHALTHSLGLTHSITQSLTHSLSEVHSDSGTQGPSPELGEVEVIPHGAHFQFQPDVRQLESDSCQEQIAKVGLVFGETALLTPLDACAGGQLEGKG